MSIVSGMQFACILVGLLVVAAIFSAHHTWWKVPKPWGKGWARVVLYHHICPTSAPSAMNTQPHSFERQIRWLKRRKAQFCTLSELVGRMNRQEEGRFVAITLDDGYVDNFTQAYRIIKKHGAKMTVFINPGIQDPGLLDVGQIQTMQQSGCVEFGAHTLTHPDLTRLDDVGARHEIDGSIRATEAVTGVPCTSFAYPFGRFGERDVRLAREAGMVCAVGIKSRIMPWSDVDPHAMPRIGTNGKVSHFQFCLAFSRGRHRL